MKKPLKTTIFIATILLLALSCQKEENPDANTETQTDIQKELQVKMTNWSHFSETNPKVSERITTMQAQNALARNTQSELYGFVIDTSRVQIIEQTGFTTYSFAAIRQQPTSGISENYLYKQNDDGTYQQYLLGYYCTSDAEGNISYTSDDLQITPIDDPSLLSRDSCYPEFVQVGVDTVCTAATVCFGSNADGSHSTAEECQCEERGLSNCYEPGTITCNNQPIFGWTNCPGGLPDNTSPDPNNPQNGGGTPTGTYTTPDGTVYTILVPHPALDNVLACINGNNGVASLNDPTILTIDANMIYTMNAYWKPMSIYLQDNGCSEKAQEFAIAVAEAGPDTEVDYIEEYLYTDTPDDNFNYQGPLQLIPNQLTLTNGTNISIQFGTTTDNINANQPVSPDLIDGIKFAIELANSNLSTSDQITSIFVMCTTNGHGTIGTSNHLKATAVDISRINGQTMISTGVSNQIIELQNSMDNFQYVRENFGPSFKHKYDINTNIWNYNYNVSGHNDHIHFSVRR